MPLTLAIKNRSAIVVATDTDGIHTHSDPYGQIVALPNRSVVLIAGNLDSVRHAVAEIAFPKVHAGLGAAGLAQLIHAALVLDVIPHLSQLKGRVEIIVAGIDPIRHTEQPGLYYFDSAQNFELTIVEGDVVAAGSTAAVASLFEGHTFSDADTNHLLVLAKECLSATKLRWPTVIGNHIELGIITPQNMRFQQF